MFVALFGWGASISAGTTRTERSSSPSATSFILGIIGGYKAKN